jgi:hypothetical protein
MKTETMTAGPRVGDVLVSTWGYDQTTVDFWKVVGLTPSGKSARIVPVAQRVVARFTGSEQVVPAPLQQVSGDEDPTTSLVRWYDFRDGHEWCVGVPVGHRNTARLWDGRPVHQTAWGWGH